MGLSMPQSAPVGIASLSLVISKIIGNETNRIAYDKRWRVEGYRDFEWFLGRNALNPEDNNRHLPQLAETNSPRSIDVVRGRLFYNNRVKRVFIADARVNERSDLRLRLVDIAMQVVGEAAGWRSVLTFGPTTHPDVVVVDWGLISTRCVAAMKELRHAYPSAVLMIVPGHMNAHQRSKLVAGTDENIDKGELLGFWSNDFL
jgi:hypothetical protein